MSGGTGDRRHFSAESMRSIDEPEGGDIRALLAAVIQVVGTEGKFNHLAGHNPPETRFPGGQLLPSCRWSPQTVPLTRQYVVTACPVSSGG